MSTFSVILLSILYIELIAFGVFMTMPKVTDRIFHEIDLGIKIILTFFLWASQCGTEKYTITTTYDGKTKTIEFG